jgi:dTDP-4-amino-4,6-dideoxygalactose transaminase
MTTPLPFNRVHITKHELEYVRQAIEGNHLSGDGPFTKRCHEWLERTTGTAKALLTHSGTAALEMSAILADVGSGDEVIMPSFTFPSTANAFVLRGSTPVFVDVDPRTLNMHPERVREAVTDKTRAVVPVHYAGVACDMNALMAIAADAGLLVIEDAAQALLARGDGRPLGTIGQMGALSFHETKNVTSGEGGALLVNDPALLERAEIVREKGTNRSRFFRGLVDKYTWVDVGSSFLPSELQAAFLFAQLEHAEQITARRVAIWDAYHAALASLESDGFLLRPLARPDNGHIYYVLLKSEKVRSSVIAHLKSTGISAVFHYVPLHSSPAGMRFGRTSGSMHVTDDISERLVRFPVWPDMTEEDVERVVGAVGDAVRG